MIIKKNLILRSKNIEKKLGKPVVTSDNAINFKEKEKIDNK